MRNKTGEKTVKKVAQSTCVRCHHIYPRTEMTQKTVTSHSGNSYGVYNLFGGSGTKKAKGSARVHYRKKQIWVCNDCSWDEMRNIFYMVTGLAAMYVYTVYM